VGDAEYLRGLSEFLELAADGFRGPSADAAVNFVEDQGALRSGTASA
jgi:hypothetical protein